MREIILTHLFSIISYLRRIEVGLITDEQPEDAETVRAVNRTLSAFRDKLITMQLTEATEKLNNATLHLQLTSSDLQSYLATRETAGNRLETILANLPVAVALLNTLID